ncbi:hypothetical protein ACMFMG_011243 [Clarireedia jacksonii]
MHYLFISAALLASSVFAQTPGFDVITSPTENKIYKVGTPLNITWVPNAVTGTIMIQLMEGATPGTLQSVNNLDNHYLWTIPSTVGNFATYGIQITLDGTENKTFQWSFPFHIEQ